MNRSPAAPTPGPWKVISEAAAREVEVFEIAEVSHFRVICDGRGDGFAAAGDPFCDARLIAAAPALLEALIGMCRNFPTDSDMAEAGWAGHEIESACRAYEAARAAIEAATGEKA